MARVLVTGIGVASAIGIGRDDFALALREGRVATAIGETPGALPSFALNVSESLALLPGLPPELRQEAARIARRLALPLRASIVSALQAWDHAKLHVRAVDPKRVSLVIAGHNLSGRYAFDTYRRYDAEGFVSPEYGLLSLDSSQIGVLSELLKIRGEGVLVGGASASGNMGILHGYRLVEWGVADICLVVGALTEPSAVERRAWANMGALDESGSACRPFDLDRAGFVPGQASACLVLESHESAAARRVEGQAHLAGVATCLDGNRLPNPSIEGEVEAMTRALGVAGLTPDCVQYINAHGTGSQLGDEVELHAIESVFGLSASNIWLNSSKALTGHCLCAAGVVEAVATILQMKQKFVHCNPHLNRPMREGFRFVGRESVAVAVDVAMSNSFGFGGINSSLVLTRPRPASDIGG